jgi:hypothetical protein
MTIGWVGKVLGCATLHAFLVSRQDWKIELNKSVFKEYIHSEGNKQ